MGGGIRGSCSSFTSSYELLPAVFRDNDRIPDFEEIEEIEEIAKMAKTKFLNSCMSFLNSEF
jgi:hypothetical protein